MAGRAMSTISQSTVALETEASKQDPRDFTLRAHQESRDDPSRKQQDTKIPPQYVPILPKPPVVVKPQPKSAAPLRRCRVPICVIAKCNLKSHRFYIPTKKSKSSSKPATVALNGTHQSQPRDKIAEANSTHSPPYRLFIEQVGLDGLPALPGDGLDPSAIRTLFHMFFVREYDRIFRIILPPPVTKCAKQVAQKLKENALARASSSPIYCLHYAASAHLGLIWKTDNGRPNRDSVILQGKVMNLLRAKLNDLVEAEIQDIITVIFNLCMFELSNRRLKSLTFHRDALVLLLTRCGGHQNLNITALAIFLNLDRTLSIFTGLPPIYEPAPNNFIRKPPTAPFAYGSYLTEPASYLLLTDDIHRYSYDVCRAIELFEQQGWSFDPNDGPMPESPHIHYFYFLRDCIVNEFVRLNASTSRDKTVARCFLLATKIVEYTALSDNYMPYLTHGIADKLHTVLCAEDQNIKWQDHPEMLIWILFILTSMAYEWNKGSWALEYLRRQLEIKYGGEIWPVDWRQRELENIHRYVWSDTRFNARFTKACNELQYSTAGSREISPCQVEQIR